MNLPDFQIPVPANPPDAGTVIYVGFNQEWIPALLGVVEILRDENVWLTPPSDIVPQVDELIGRLQDTVIVSPQIFPSENWHFHSESAVLHGNALAWTADNAQMLGGFFSQSAAALDDEFQFNMALKAGIHKMTFFVRTGAGSGIITLTTDEGHSYTIDLYAAATANNVHKTVNVTIDADGNHTFNCKMHTKNASSAGYNCNLGYIMA